MSPFTFLKLVASLQDAFDLLPGEKLITPGMWWGDFQEWDSLTHVSFHFTVEQAFDVEIDPEVFLAFESLEQLGDHLERRQIETAVSATG